MFLRMKIQEMIFQETQKQKETQSTTSSSQMQLFHYEDGRSNEGERGQHGTAQFVFPDYSASDNCVIFEVTCFSITQHPTRFVGSLSLPYLSSQ